MKKLEIKSDLFYLSGFFVKIIIISPKAYPSLEFGGILKAGSSGEFEVIQEDSTSNVKFLPENVKSILSRTKPPVIELQF